MPTIAIDDLSLTLGSRQASRLILDRLGFAVADGECFGLVGESGSGKSTILRCLTGLYTTWTGTIAVDGHAIGHPLTLARSRLMQMVFQDPYASLHPRHMVDTILREPLSMHGIADADARIARVLAQVGLDSRHRYAFPNALSGGQRQRVAIARALLLEPSILLLDEPTSALDVSVQAEILNLLAAIRRERRLTCILVSHDLAVVAHMCGRLAVLQRGRVVEVLARHELVAGRASTDYARQLIAASGPYRRELAVS